MKASIWVGTDEMAAKPLAVLEAKPAGKACDILAPEETIFGIVSRYHVLTGNPTSGDTLIELLSRRSITLSTAFPSGLHLILKRLGLPVGTVEELIEGHMILPCFRPFMSSVHYTRIAQSVAAGAANNTKIALGLLASRVGAEEVLRFCPSCAKADCETIGIATWYRVHQFPGVLICPYHGVPLAASHCLAKRLRRQQLFLPTVIEKWSEQQRMPEFDELTREKLLRIARLISQLLLLPSTSVDQLTWRNRYLAHLVDRQLATTTLRVRQQALRSELLDFWTSIRDLPGFDGIFARCDEDDSWLTSLYRRPRSTHHPLLHVLLIGFLAESIETFLWAGISSHAIAPARQRRASTATESKIATLAADGLSIRQVAEELGLSVNAVLVKAEKIGVGFTRRPKKVDAAVRSQVRRALAAGNPILGIVKATGLSASTVNRILGADCGLQSQRVANKRDERRMHARDKLRAAVVAAPSAGFKVLQATLGADFIWLYRHDRAWLQDQLSSTLRITVHASLVDWSARDMTMVERVRLAVAEILEPSRRSVRVTVNEIGRRTGNASWLDKHLTRLPNTAKLLAEVLESTAAFRARRVAYGKKHSNLDG